MDHEIQNFIKVWIKTILCLCYCYFIASRVPKGFLRLLSLIPIFYIFLLLPLNLHSFHLAGPTTLLLVWLCPFKLLLFSFDQGPLSPLPPNILHFILLSSLPIKIEPNAPYHHKTPQKKPEIRISLLTFIIEALLLAAIVYTYEFRERLHPRLIALLYCCNVYLGLELVLALFAAPARAVFGFEMAPHFHKPYLSTSLQDFWGRRWNLMVTSILRPTVYDPIRRICTPFLGLTYGPLPAMMAAFLVSGLMHELIYYYLTRVPPTWEVTWFFVFQGTCTAVEVVVKKAVGRRGWRLHRAVSGPLTVAFLVVTSEWWFFPQLVRNGVDRKTIGEYATMVGFVKSKLL
ncbi:putative long-chain-alcohol O-fatty-acyltransferase 5 [Senna tora]|uniref:Putative long-chain-alcohol O-fatty-acyltransferase 5 n=1 Tax=Senna tora TaxID=362788 RepID=A0A834T480_9FABA|nr:putative long-chain-alcohol O-fatty-acyltransferase 5 [Senna tora]